MNNQHQIFYFMFNSNVLLHRGVGAMEIVAMDMKVSGMYIARQLSFSGVSFRIEEISLDDDFKVVYNKAAKLVSYTKDKTTFCHTNKQRLSTYNGLILFLTHFEWL